MLDSTFCVILQDTVMDLNVILKYIVEKYDENHNVITEALTPKGNVRQISINPEWKYYKNKIKSKFSSPKGMAIYHQREFDVESVFGTLETNLRFNRFTVRKL